jgi:hypothetical protein
VPLTGWKSRRRQAASATVVLAVAFAVLGCGGGSDPQSQPSSPLPTSRLLAAGEPVDGAALTHRLKAAITRAGGCTMESEAGPGRDLGVVHLQSLNAAGMVDDVWGQGTITGADGRSVQYVSRWGTDMDHNGFYVNDGTLIDGHHWARMPQFTNTLLDPKALVAAHPLFVAPGEILPDVQPDMVAVVLYSTGKDSIRSAGPETVGGVNAAHYLWNLNGKLPKAGSTADFEIWMDEHDLPVRVLAHLSNGLPVTADYRHWEKRESREAAPHLGHDRASRPGPLTPNTPARTCVAGGDVRRPGDRRSGRTPAEARRVRELVAARPPSWIETVRLDDSA